MSQSLRVCLFNREVQQSFHQPFQAFPNLRIVGEVASEEELLECVERLQIDLVVVNLDSEGALGVVDQVRRSVTQCSILGISTSSRPEDIIKAMRAGCNQYVRWPVDSNDLCEALNQISAQIVPRVIKSRRICVLGASGGAGATTIACNLAIELAAVSGSECGLVDLNLELGDAGCLFDAQPDYSIADVCKENMEVDDAVLQRAFHKLPWNVSILIRPPRLEDTYQVTPDGVGHMLNQAKGMFRFVVADLPRVLDPTSAMALNEADRVLLVAQMTVASIRNATRIRDWLRKLGTLDDNISVVLNRASPGVGHITAEDMATHLGSPVFAIVPNDYRWVQTSLDMGYATARKAARNPVQVAIHAIARRIASNLCDDEPLVVEPPEPFLKRLWRRRKAPKPVAVST